MGRLGLKRRHAGRLVGSDAAIAARGAVRGVVSDEWQV